MRANTTAKVSGRPRSRTALLNWLIEPAAALSEPERRRSRVLAIMTVTQLASSALFLPLVLISALAPQRELYLLLIVSLQVLFVLAFGLNHAGHYLAAAGLLIASSVLGTWFAIVLNLALQSIDAITLSYVLIPVLLCSILLPTQVTVFLAASELAALIVLALFNPPMINPSWEGLVVLVLFISVLSVVAHFISRKDLEQIDRQTRELQESQAHLRELSVRDPLTGLFNRRYLEETLERELGRAARNKLPLGIVMLDIDHFKNFNDAHGHAAGDMLLRRLGDLLRRSVRESDIACRYGGEEFILILPEASLEVTRARAEHLRLEAGQIRIQSKGQELEPITLSLGAAIFPEHGSTGATLLAAADAALYRAKREGRDRVGVGV